MKLGLRAILLLLVLASGLAIAFLSLRRSKQEPVGRGGEHATTPLRARAGLRGGLRGDPLGSDSHVKSPAEGDDSRSVGAVGKRELAVYVRDENGEPVPDVEIAVAPADAPRSDGGVGGDGATTNLEGVARLAIPWSQYPLTLAVIDEGWRVGTHAVASPAERVTVTLPRGTLCRVVVRDHLGAPVEGALVRFSQRTPTAPNRDRPTTSQVTDAEGTAVLPLRLRPSIVGDLEVLPHEGSGAFEPKHALLWIPLEQSSLTVVRRALISGRVVTSDGDAVPFAKVAHRAGSGMYVSSADAGGLFKIWGLAGVATQMAARGRYSEGGGNLSDETSKRVVPPCEGVVLEVPSGRRLRVQLDGTQESVTYHYFLISEPDRIDRRASAAHSTIEFNDLDPKAHYSVWVQGGKDSYAHARQIPGNAGEIRLSLQRGSRLAGQLRAPATWSVRNMTIFDAGVYVRATLQGDGRFVLDGVPPGRYQVSVLLISTQGSSQVEITTDEIVRASGPIDLVLPSAEREPK